MSFFQKLFGGSTSPSKSNNHYYTFTVKCKRCGELIEGRIDLGNDLSVEYDEYDGETYHVHKMLMGENRCFQRMEVELKFNSKRELTERQVAGGEFV